LLPSFRVLFAAADIPAVLAHVSEGRLSLVGMQKIKNLLVCLKISLFYLSTAVNSRRSLAGFYAYFCFKFKIYKNASKMKRIKRRA
jgi:hypothetical protein